MTTPDKLYHFGKSEFIGKLRKNGEFSFGLAAGFARSGLTAGQQDDEMRRTVEPPIERTELAVGESLEKAQPIRNLVSVKVSLGLQVPYFMKCFSLGYSDEMYAEVGGDMCVVITDVGGFFERFERSLGEQLPEWAAYAAQAQYWDFARIPVGMNQRDLMFLKDKTKYSSQDEYRIVLLPPEGWNVRSLYDRVTVSLGSLEDIAEEQRPDPLD